MKKYTCPSCGAEITFQSSITVSCVCPYCRSLVVRQDMNVEAIGVMAELPEDMSPFQLGTNGIYENVHFSLIGRMRIGWDDGYWNEWFMYTDEGKKGWLAEAQGFLAISFEEQESGIPDASPRLNESLKLRDTQFWVTDIKNAECVGSEGELPLAAPKGRRGRSIDMLGRHGEFASIEYPETGAPRFYFGKYVEFDALKFSNLRELDGWKPEPAQGMMAQ